MSVLPRALLTLAFLVGATLVPTAVADDCLEIKSNDFAEGLRVIANTGQQLALGVTSGVPGDGLTFLVIITPDLCGAPGLGTIAGAGVDPTGLLAELPQLIPLP